MTKDNNTASHDGLFKKLMETQIGIQEFLKYYLPLELRQEIDLSTARLEKESYVEENLRKLLSDVVISVKKKDREKVYTYALIEHQSSSDKWIAFRLLEYTIRLLKHHKTKREKLPLVYPVVVYNGIKPYTAPRNIWGLFEEPDKAKEIMSGDYELVDLRSMPDEDIIGKGHIGIMEYAMKHIHDKDAPALLDSVLSNFKQTILEDRKMDYVYLKSLLWYTSFKITREQKSELSGIIRKHLNKREGEEVMRSLAQSYIDEGVEKGIEQGIEKGIEKGREESMVKAAKALLKQGVSLAIITEATGLPKSRIEKLKKGF